MSFTARDVKDRIVQYPNRYQLSPVAGTTDTYDLTPAPGTVTEEGTEINKAYLQPIENEATKIPHIEGILNTVVFGLNPRAHSVTITSSQSWMVPAGVTEVDVWLVGGGGGAKTGTTCGGGGGGYCAMHKNISVTSGNSYTVTIGAGGTAGSSPTTGGSTSAFGYSVNGGSMATNREGGDGGSGGGSIYGLGGSGGTNGTVGGSSTWASVKAGKGQGVLGTINPYTGILYAAGGNGSNAGTPAVGANNTGNGGGAGYAGGSGICIIYWD